MAYLPIEDHGLIGNMHTAALVGRNGSIDWLCLPNFDSPSVFAAILDAEKGGYFRVAPAADCNARKQLYWPETNILITRFLCGDGVVEVIDYMPVGVKAGQPGFRQLVRRVEAIRGSIPLRIECIPAFNYARDRHKVELTSNGAVFHGPNFDLDLSTTVPLEIEQAHGGVRATLALEQGQRAAFVLGMIDEAHPLRQVHAEEQE